MACFTLLVLLRKAGVDSGSGWSHALESTFVITVTIHTSKPYRDELRGHQRHCKQNGRFSVENWYLLTSNGNEIGDDFTIECTIHSP